MTPKYFLTAALAAFIAQNAAADTLRIATEGAYPPFNFVDESGEVQGFDVDIAKALCAEMQADCEIVTQA
jgi:ABC-type amino acid transport substrate-binding protein